MRFTRAPTQSTVVPLSFWNVSKVSHCLCALNMCISLLDNSFGLKIRNALDLSQKCYLEKCGWLWFT